MSGRVFDDREIAKTARWGVRSDPFNRGYRITVAPTSRGPIGEEPATTIYVVPRYVRNIDGEVVMECLVVDVSHAEDGLYVPVEVRA